MRKVRHSADCRLVEDQNCILLEACGSTRNRSKLGCFCFVVPEVQNGQMIITITILLTKSEIFVQYCCTYVCAYRCILFWANYFYLFICLFIADTKSIVWTHTLCRTQVEKTDNTERSTRHWSRRNHMVTDTFCNCIEDRTIGLQTHS